MQQHKPKQHVDHWLSNIQNKCNVNIKAVKLHTAVVKQTNVLHLTD